MSDQRQLQEVTALAGLFLQGSPTRPIKTVYHLAETKIRFNLVTTTVMARLPSTPSVYKISTADSARKLEAAGLSTSMGV